jgi:hypothetical protein
MHRLYVEGHYRAGADQGDEEQAKSKQLAHVMTSKQMLRLRATRRARIIFSFVCVTVPQNSALGKRFRLRSRFCAKPMPHCLRGRQAFAGFVGVWAEQHPRGRQRYLQHQKVEDGTGSATA